MEWTRILSVGSTQLDKSKVSPYKKEEFYLMGG